MGLAAATLSNDAHVLNSYLELWTCYESMDRLWQAWKLARVLGALHQVVSYQNFLINLEPDARSDLEGGITEFVQIMLEAVAELPD